MSTRRRTFTPFFAEYQAQIGIEPLRILKGTLPPAKQDAVLAWAALRKEGLLNIWYNVQAKKNPGKVP
jgi:hypothetical protein